MTDKKTKTRVRAKPPIFVKKPIFKMTFTNPSATITSEKSPRETEQWYELPKPEQAVHAAK